MIEVPVGSTYYSDQKILSAVVQIRGFQDHYRVIVGTRFEKNIASTAVHVLTLEIKSSVFSWKP